jgi:hypothetical protein
MDPNKYRNPPNLIPKETEQLKDGADSLPIIAATVNYVIYCHGGQSSDSFVLPLYNGKMVSYNSCASYGKILYGAPINIQTICEAEDIPAFSKKSGQTENNLNLAGGVPIGFPLGIYTCYVDESGAHQYAFIYDMPHSTVLDTYSNVIENIIFPYHTIHHFPYNRHIRITLHTCMVAEGYRPGVDPLAPGAHMNKQSVDELSDVFNKKIDIANAMEYGGKMRGRQNKTSGKKSGKKRRKSKKYNKTVKKKNRKPIN